MRSTTPILARLSKGPFQRAQDLGEQYVLSLDPEKLLAPYFRESGLNQEASRYPNWEDSGLDGHTLGHVLSAAAHSATATGNPDATRLVEKLVAGLRTAQLHLGTGYVGGIPHGAELWERIASGSVEPDSFGLNGAWVPWYNLHKLFAGLLDAHKLLGTAEALNVVTELADWWVAIARTMTDESFEAMLRTEFGAMNAAYADLYEITGNPDHAWLATRFTDRAFFEPLFNGQHLLPGMHANTQIAKAFGYARVGHATQAPQYLAAAAKLWKLVVDNHTYIFGGNSTREHFTDSLHAGFNSEQGPETCNTYNMLRLTNELLTAPAEILEVAGITEHALLDYYERALFNHILPSQHPTTGGLVYFTPVRPDHYRVYSQAQECFWCCVGTGMENHARYTERLYTLETESKLGSISVSSVKINLGIASTLRAPELGLEVEVLTTASESSDLVVRINKAPDYAFEVSLRLPWWSRRNGESSWRSSTQTWQEGTEIRVPLAKRLTAHVISPSTAVGPDSDLAVSWIAFQRGPQVLVSPTTSEDLVGLHADDSRMGHVAQGPMRELSKSPQVVVGKDAANAAYPADVKSQAIDSVLVAHKDEVSEALADPELAPAIASILESETARSVEPAIVLPVYNPITGQGSAVSLQPFADTHETRYTMYFPLVNAGDTETDEAETARERLHALDEIALGDVLFTLDVVAAGEQQPESDHGFEGHQSFARQQGTQHWREATNDPANSSKQGNFGYELRTQRQQPRVIQLLLGHQDGASAMTVEIDGTVVETIELPARPIESEPPFIHEVLMPAHTDKNKPVRVRFSTSNVTITPRVFNVRLMK